MRISAVRAVRGPSLCCPAEHPYGASRKPPSAVWRPRGRPKHHNFSPPSGTFQVPGAMPHEGGEKRCCGQLSRHLFVLPDLRTVWTVYRAAWRLMPDTRSNSTPFHPTLKRFEAVQGLLQGGVRGENREYYS